MSHLNNIRALVASILFVFATPLMATQYEITPYVGKVSSSDLTVPDSTTSVSLDSATTYGLGFAWQESPNGQGQILVNYISHDLKLPSEDQANEQTSSFDVLYAHFNGIAQFRQRQYITTVSIGLGAARFSTDAGNEISPSFTAALGTRYEISDVASVVTEIRAYASLMQDGDTLFCQEDVCAAEFDDSVWIDTAISVGFSYKF